MERERQCRVNLSAPNLVNICVDISGGGEMSGRLYHCYAKEPQRFSNVVQLLKLMEELFDGIAFPQASTMSRHFKEQVKGEERIYRKMREQKELFEYRGKEGTFITSVCYRQNSAWQGDVIWVEKERKEAFVSTLEFIKLISNWLASDTA